MAIAFTTKDSFTDKKLFGFVNSAPRESSARTSGITPSSSTDQATEFHETERTAEPRQGTFVSTRCEGAQKMASGMKQNGGHQGSQCSTRATLTSSASLDDAEDKTRRLLMGQFCKGKLTSFSCKDTMALIEWAVST